MNKIISLKSFKLSCASCRFSQLCLPCGFNHNEFEQFEQTVKHERTLKKGETLFEQGDPLKSLYMVHAGFVKMSLLAENGDRQIVGFHMPGEILGFDAIENDVHTCTAEALDSSSICELPYDQLSNLCQQVPALYKNFMALMSHDISDKHEMMMLLGKKSGEARVTILLLNLALKFHARGYSGTEFNLGMSRLDMSNYLGLAVETVSRFISHIQEEKIIQVDRKYIRILDMPKLRMLAGVSEQCVHNLDRVELKLGASSLPGGGL